MAAPEQTQKKKSFMAAKIVLREDALAMVKEASTAFFFIAGLEAVLSFLVGFSILFDAAVFAIGAFFLRRFNSRAAAVVLLLLAIAATASTVGNRLGGNYGGGGNVFLACIVLWVAARAVEATFKLHGRLSADAADDTVPSQDGNT